VTVMARGSFGRSVDGNPFGSERRGDPLGIRSRVSGFRCNDTAVTRPSPWSLSKVVKYERFVGLLQVLVAGVRVDLSQYRP
jgi:hypothetical protein